MKSDENNFSRSSFMRILPAALPQLVAWCRRLWSLSSAVFIVSVECGYHLRWTRASPRPRRGLRGWLCLHHPAQYQEPERFQRDAREGECGPPEGGTSILGSLAKENHEALEQYGSARLGKLSAVKPQVANPGLGAVLLGDDPFVVSDLNFCEMVIFA